MTILSAPECSSETLSSLVSFYTTDPLPADASPPDVRESVRPSQPRLTSLERLRLALDRPRGPQPRPLHLLIRLTNCTLDLVL